MRSLLNLCNSLLSLFFWRFWISVIEHSWRALHRLYCRNRRWHSLNAELRMTDRSSGEKSLHELEFNDLNIHLYLTLNYGTDSEHLDLDFMVLYNVFVLSSGLTISHNSICTISDLDRSRLTNTRSAENARIGADTDPEYRIDASLSFTCVDPLKLHHLCIFLRVWVYYNFYLGTQHAPFHQICKVNKHTQTQENTLVSFSIC